MGKGKPLFWGYASVAGVMACAMVLAISFAGMMRISTPPYAVFAGSLVIIAAVLRPLQLVFQLHPTPLKQLREDLRRHRTWLLGVGAMIVSLSLHFDAVTRIKQEIPQLQPFFADDALIALDRLLFFGHDGWELTHALFGEFATRMIDHAYAGWLLVQLAMLMYLTLSRDHWFKIRAALSLQLGWLVLGGGLAVAFASVGPCFVDDFYGSQDFAPLMARLESYEGLTATRAMNYLLEVQGQPALGGGISAMPSLHVAVAMLVLLMVREAWPRFQLLGWLYLAVIFIGSVHLGWHYASDGLVGGLGMVALWHASGRYCAWLRAREDVPRDEMVGADGLEPPTLSV